jgi:hypothetical protein
MKNKREHSFSIEMKSMNHLRTFSISSDAPGGVFFEGFLGDIVKLSMVDGMLLEIKGTKGTLRIDLNEEEVKEISPPTNV